MRHSKFRTAVMILLPLVLLLALAGAASADVKLTSVLNSWDYGWDRWENGMMDLTRANKLDDPWQPFWARMGFDDDLYPGHCGDSMWAGPAQIGHYYLDTTGGAGFQKSRNWRLVKCSTFVDNTPYVIETGDLLAECTENGTVCRVFNIDTKVPCSTGNCTTEITTDFELDLEADTCGTVKFDEAKTGNLCMWWEAQRPTKGMVPWQGNIQVRITSADGDKTINFKMEPTAVGLRNFGASARAAGVNPLAVVLGIALVGLSGLALAWRSARG